MINYQIIPAILEKNFEEIKNKINKIEDFIEWAQLDICDGSFVDSQTWYEPKDLKNLNSKINLEIHLLVDNPEDVIQSWYEAGAKRVVFHYEALNDLLSMLKVKKRFNRELAIAFNPESSWQDARHIIQEFDLILFLSVIPGAQGRPFIPEVLEKIKTLRASYPKINIGIDGGINDKNIQEAKNSGANIFYVGSYIWNGNAKENLNRLKEIIKK